MKQTLIGIVALASLGGGCSFNERNADMFARRDAHFPRNFWKGLALYVPNRLVDFVDMVHAGFGIGLVGTNVELHPTRYTRLGAGADLGAGIAWLGRFTPPGEAGMYARAVAGENEALSMRGTKWRVPRWDIGVRLSNLYAGIAPDEVADFFAGLVAFDLKGDDWGTGF